MKKINGNQTRKHAYLIMVHHNFKQLLFLISLLDDVRNDIYLHIDKKIDKEAYIYIYIMRYRRLRSIQKYIL